jgi:hypothetical protein
MPRDAEHPRLITMLGKWPLSHPWVAPCIRSWARIKDVDGLLTILSDGTLDDSDQIELPGLDVRLDARAQEDAVSEGLKRFPALREIRQKDLTWRKILDTVLCPCDNDLLLLIDTDVYVRRQILVDAGRFDPAIVYMREDIPAYNGHWSAPFREEMVLSFNAGFVMFRRSSVDLAFLNHVASTYVLGRENYWWSEQLAWSMVAGRSPRRYYWDGDSARVISGFGTRSETEISNNSVKMFSKYGSIQSSQQMVALSGRAPVIHMAGWGKKHFEALLPGDDTQEVCTLSARSDKLLNPAEKLQIAARLAGRGVVESIRRWHGKNN